jgi:hypothetical protein
MASYQIPVLESFNFAKPEEWPRWIRRFERFRQASGLNTKSEESQVNTLIYSMGEKADDIFHSFRLSEADGKKYQPVKSAFEGHFVKHRNIIFERAKFNSRKQEQGEPVDNFIVDLYTLAENCQYGALREEMIRDRIVVGIGDGHLAEKLQLDPDLTLEKAVPQARQSEAVKQQQSTVREGNVEQPLAAIGEVGKSRFKPIGMIQQNTRGQHVTDVVEAHPTQGNSAQHGKLFVISAIRKDTISQYAGQKGQGMFVQWKLQSRRRVKMTTHSWERYGRM